MLKQLFFLLLIAFCSTLSIKQRHVTAEQIQGNTIGIDFGTSYSSVGIWRNDKVQVIPYAENNTQIPSSIDVGSRNTIFDSKRLIGRKMDQYVKNLTKVWPFKVQKGQDNNIQITTQYNNDLQSFSIEEISSMTFTKIKEIAQNYIGQPIKNAVISVPPTFSDDQMKAIIDAGSIAGLNVIKLVSQTTAAAIAYSLQKNISTQKNVIVFNFGAGFLSVASIAIEKKSVYVKAVSGDNNLGGRDFDDLLSEHLAKQFLRKYKLDIRNDKKAMQRMRTTSQKAKKTLSGSTITSFSIDSLFSGQDFYTSTTRGRFQQLCMPLFKKSITHIEKVLKESKLSKSQIHEVIIVGGSTKIPLMQKLIQDFFNGKQLYKQLKPQAIAYGATIRAAIQSGKKSDLFNGLEISEIRQYPSKGNLSNTQIQKLHNRIEEIYKSYVIFKLTQQCIISQQQMKYSDIDNADKQTIIKKAKQIQEWMKNSKSASRKQFNLKLNQLNTFKSQIMSKYKPKQTTYEGQQ